MFSFFTSNSTPGLPSFKIENNLAIYEKEKLNDLELKIYNPEYFHSIGFDNVIVDLVPIEITNTESEATKETQKGGYYNKEQYKKLSIPFKYFVYMVQGPGKDIAPEQETKVQNPVGKLTSLFGNVKSWFKKSMNTEKPVVTETPIVTEKPIVTETPEVIETPISETPIIEAPVTEIPEVVEEPKVTESKEVTEEPEVTESKEVTEEPVVETKEPSGKMKWVVKITFDPSSPPICNTENKDEKSECDLIEKIKQVKKQRDVGVIINGPLYDIGGRPVMLGDVVENSRIKITETGLPNTLVDKYNRRGWM